MDWLSTPKTSSIREVCNSLHSSNPAVHMSDLENISPYNINTISSRQVMRIKKSNN